MQRFLRRPWLISRAVSPTRAAYLRIDEARARLAELEEQASAPDLWDDADHARAGHVGAVGVSATTSSSSTTSTSVVVRPRDAVRARRAKKTTTRSSRRSPTASRRCAADLDQLELRALFSGEHDERDAICEIHSGAGGTDAQDWAEMLLRMFTRWAQNKGFDVELDEVQEGQEAGITSATFIVKGRYAYGMLQGERGVHRLIRISPFDANARRQTAFASFDCVPALEEAEAARDRSEATCASTRTARRARAAST